MLLYKRSYSEARQDICKLTSEYTIHTQLRYVRESRSINVGEYSELRANQAGGFVKNSKARETLAPGVRFDQDANRLGSDSQRWQ